jgi:hypothetical protein
VIRRSIVAAAILALALPVAAQGQKGAPEAAKAPTKSEIESLRQKVAADKKLVIAKNLSLNAPEETAFWPLYEDYQKDLKGIDDRLTKLIKSYAEAYGEGGIADPTAKSLLADTLAVEEAELKAKKSIVAKMEKVLASSRVARYIQLENKIRAIVRFDMADKIPLAGYKD